MKKMSDYKDSELLDLVTLGRAARDFYDKNEFFRNVFEPAVITEAERVRKSARWNPQMPADPAGQGMVTAYVTGKEDGLLYLEDFVKRCVREQDMASKELQERAEKRAKAEKKEPK